MSPPNRYLKGQRATCSASFSDSTDTLVDPATVTFKVKLPAGTTTTYVYGTDAQLVKAGTGRYYVLLDLDTTGSYTYRFESTGTYKGAEEQRLDVDGGAF